MNKLYKYQEDALPILMARRHNLLADEPGLGKTIQALELINRLNIRRVLIIVKASIKIQWARMANQWLKEKRVIQIINKKTDKLEEFADIIIVNYDLVIHSFIFLQLSERQWGLMICDEAHYLKNKDARRTRAILAKNGLAHRATRSLMLTGTPILNRPIELYPMLKTFAPAVMGKYNDYWKYAKRYCDAWQDGFTMNVSGASHTDELNQQLRQYYMIRRLTHEVEIQLPKRRYEMVFVDSTEGIKRKFDQANRTSFKYQDLNSDGGSLATLRRQTAEEKLRVTIDYIKEQIESAGKSVIFAYHHSVIEALAKNLASFQPQCLTGANTQFQRDRAINIFRSDVNCKILIGQIQAAGEGIDGLQDVCSNVLFLEWSWVPGEIEQACKRIHRIGQKKPVLIRFLVWADSVEEHMMRVALEKVKVIKEILK